MECDSIAKNETLEKEDYVVLRRFSIFLRKLCKQNKETMERLNLQSKVPDLLAEIITVLELHDRFKTKQIKWFGGRRKNYDIQIGSKEIQVKNITTSGKWHMRNHDFEKYKLGKKPKQKISVPRAMKALKPKYSYPYIFVNLADLRKPIFYCYSKRRILKAIETTLKHHNEWVKRPRERGKGQKNLWDPTVEMKENTKSKFKDLEV